MEFRKIEVSRPARDVLAVIGFLALVAGGITLAVYSARYVPGAISRLSTAAVSLSSVFNFEGGSLEVIPGGGLPFGPTTPTTTTTPAPSTPAPSTGGTPPATTPGTPSSGVYPIGSPTNPPTLSGLPDFAVRISAVGYLVSTSTSSFVATTTIPARSRVAVKFTIQNQGTNASGSWRFSASIPTDNAYIFESPVQQSLLPGENIEYILGFDQAKAGSDMPIAISVDYEKKVSESDENNNGASEKVTVLGS